MKWTEEYLGLPKTQSQAQARGIKHYFTGVPCVHGHTVPRQASNTNCIECSKMWREKKSKLRKQYNTQRSKTKSDAEEISENNFHMEQIKHMRPTL